MMNIQQFQTMNEPIQLRSQTLGNLHTEPQTINQCPQSIEPSIFPKISTQLKKTKFIKFRSSIINTTQARNQHEFHQGSQSSFKKRINSNSRKVDKSYQRANRLQINHKMWRLNKNRDQLYRSNSKNRENKLIQPIKSQVALNPQCTGILLTETRDLNDTPLQLLFNKKLRSNSQINETIHRSNKMIALIRKNSVRPIFSQQKSKARSKSTQILQQKLGDFVTKHHQLTHDKIKQYFKSPSNKKLQAKINYEARVFLQQKLHNDYKQHKEVEKLREKLSTEAIQSEIKQKNKQFHQDYKKMYSVPFLSYLSLPNNIKQRVLQNLTQSYQL